MDREKGGGTQYNKNKGVLEGKWMYQYNGKCIEIDGIKHEFKYDIRKVVKYEGRYVVLLSIPFNSQEINNIYCLDSQGNLVWRSEDLATLYPTIKNLPYEQMGIKDDAIYASDFYGRNYKINLDTGKIEDCTIVK